MAKKRKLRPEAQANQELRLWRKELELGGYEVSQFPGLLVWHPDTTCTYPVRVEFLIGRWVVTFPYRRYSLNFKYFAAVQKHVKAWLEGDPLGE
jgi:hypothetical protein